MYVLVVIEGNNYRIGKHEYDSYAEAQVRQKQMKARGIDIEIMSFNEAYGLTS